MPRMPANGSERLDWQDLHESAVQGCTQGCPGRPKMALRILPPEFCQLPQAERSFHLQTVEEICPAGAGGAELRPKRKCPGFTARLSEPPACSVFDPQPDVPDSEFTTRRQRFSARAGSLPRTLPQQTSIPPEPETRNGLSLARNDAFATITGSLLPACPFDSTQSPALARSIQGSSLGSVSKPKPGVSSPRTRCLRRMLALSRWLPVSTPLQAIAALWIKAFNGSHHEKLTLPDARFVSHSPMRLPFGLRFGSMFKTSLRPARLSFRKPWN
jgi:hypothetical protein